MECGRLPTQSGDDTGRQERDEESYMSGLCGILHLDGAPLDPAAVEAMAKAAAHRGPHGIRSWVEGSAGLAHLALSITPESRREHQPLVEDELTLVADARIDNRAELIPLLAGRGHLASADPTDADLILAAYRQWDRDCAARLIGDFAFAIWDQRRSRLFAARDPMAMRPFYYRTERRRIHFGSEIKQILAAPSVPAAIFEPAIATHLAAEAGPLDWTAYEGIRQLAPGHSLLAGEHGAHTWRHWDVDPDHLEYRDDQDYADHFLEIFKEALRCRLRSVQPVGLFLSGGMDSGSIASTVGWLREAGESAIPPLRTFSWAFETLPQCDERHISRKIVERYQLPATDITADDAWPLRDYPEEAPHPDEPFIGTYEALYRRGLRAAQEHGIALMLSGDGGDAAMGGNYYDYLGLLRSGRLSTAYREMRHQAQGTARGLPGVIKRYLATLATLSGRSWPRRQEPPSFPSWIRPEFARETSLREIVEQGRAMPSMDGLMRRQRYLATFWPMDLRGTMWMERLRASFGMAHVEPWNDRRITSFALAVPQWRLSLPSETKRLARRAMAGIMPEDVRRDARKVFAYPLYRRALQESATATVRDLITDSEVAARGYVDEQKLHAAYESILSNGGPTHGFWEVLTLEMWLRRHWSDRLAGAGL